VLAISQVGASESGGLYLRPEFLLLTPFIQIRLAYLRKDMTLAFFMVCWCWLSLVRSIAMILLSYCMILHSAVDADAV